MQPRATLAPGGCLRCGILPLLVLLLVFPSSLWGASRAVRVGVFPAAPLVMIEDGKPKGLFIDLIEHFAKILDWKVSYVDGTWNDLLLELGRGEIDLLPAVSFTSERLALFDFSRSPVFIDSGVIYTNPRITLHSIFDLQGKKVAGVRGSVFTTGFLEYINSFGVSCDLILAGDNRAVMAAVASGEVEAGICIYSLGNALANEYRVTLTPISFSPMALEFAVPKGRNADLLGGIDSQMSAMVGDPHSFYSQAYRKWTMPRAETEFPVWLKVGLLGFFVLGLSLAAWTFMLKRQVLTKTAYLEREISERRQAEASLTRILEEKEALIRELFHRTTNTMQVIKGMLFLQVSGLPENADLQRIVKNTEGRIDAIALVHEMLYKSQDLSRIPVSAYIRQLCASVIGKSGIPPERLSVNLELEEGFFLLDTAIPFGLILNELMSNSLRHAFPGERHGAISITFGRQMGGKYLLRYADDGVGVVEGFDFRSQDSLGLKLIFAIGEQQLFGKVTFLGQAGLSCEVEISADLYQSRV